MAAQQADAADEAGASDGASQLIRSISRKQWVRKKPMNRCGTTLAIALVALSAGVTRGDDVVVAVGGASTNMTPGDPDLATAEFVARRAFVANVRYQLPLSNHFGASIQLGWLQRGGGVDFRQTYGYYADYLQVSPRISARTSGSVIWGEMVAGPSAALRIRDRYAYSVYDPDRYPSSELPYFGRMKPWEVSAAIGAAVVFKLSSRVRGGIEAEYSRGFSNIHTPGGPGSAHDPHVYDFSATSRTVTFMCSVRYVVR